MAQVPSLPTLPAPQPVATPQPAPSPWARPADGQQPVEFDVRPNLAPPPSAPPRASAGKVIGAVVVVAMVIAGAVLFAMRGRGDEVATGAQTVTGSGTVPATTVADSTDTTVPATTVPGTSDTPAAEAYSWEALANQPPLGPQRLVVTTSTGVAEAEYEMAIEIDAARRMHIAIEGLGQSMEMVFDVESGDAYVTGMGLDAMTDSGASWLKIDMETVVELTGMDYDDFLATLDLGAELQPYEGVEPPTQEGLTEIDGETLMLYTLSLDATDFAAAVEASPELVDNPMFEGLDDITSAEYRIFLTEDSTMRRLEMTLDVFGEEMSTVMTAMPVEPDFEVALPDPADVEEIDLSQFG